MLLLGARACGSLGCTHAQQGATSWRHQLAAKRRTLRSRVAIFVCFLFLVYRACPMSLEELDTPEQLPWIDRMVEAQISALVRAGSEAAQADQPATSAVTLTTASLAGESVRGSVRDQNLKVGCHGPRVRLQH